MPKRFKNAKQKYLHCTVWVTEAIIVIVGINTKVACPLLIFFNMVYKLGKHCCEVPLVQSKNMANVCKKNWGMASPKA